MNYDGTGQLGEGIRRFKRYPAYVQSGIDWLGDIPSHWSKEPLKVVTRFVNGAAFKPEEWGDEGVPIIRIENLNGGGEFNYTNVNADPRYHVRRGDLLFAWSGNRGTSFGPFLWQADGLHYLNQHIFRLETYNLDKQWFYWLLKAVTAFVEKQAHGIIGLVHITKQELGIIRVPRMSCDEQRKIAAFLDRETAKIDALITKKERLIELLQEKRTALISHAVCKGLDPNVPMKDSGVEWLGNIPAHWSVKKLGWLSLVVRGASPRPAGDPRFFDGHHIPWITVAEITKDENKYLTTTEKMLTLEGMASSRVLPSGTLVLTNSGATLGVPKILGITGCANDGVVAFLRLSTELVRDFGYYCLSSLTRMLRERIKQGSGQPNLNTDIVKATSIPLPPYDEQNRVVAFIENVIADQNRLIEKVQEASEKLREFRTSLISAAVTGKIDVREEVA